MSPASEPKNASTFAPVTANGVVAVAGAEFAADPGGVIYWQDQRLLAVADLHLEKGSSFAARGVLLPPYDTAATLARLAALIARYAPRVVVALGDSFHDAAVRRGLPTPTGPRCEACNADATGSGSPATMTPTGPRASAGGFFRHSSLGR